MVDVVIPLLYSGSCWENNELRYCLRSLEKNMGFGFNVIVIGDEKPGWLTNSSFIKYHPGFPHELTIQSYCTFYNTVQKLEYIANNKDISSEFIYCYDDVILCRGVEKSFFYKNIAICEIKRFRGKMIKGRERWAQTVYKAAKLHGSPFYIYEHHIPVLFEKEKLSTLFKKFGFREKKIPYSPISLYFNTYFNKPDIFIHEENIAAYNQIDGSKIWLNYSDSGLPKVKEWVIEKFNKKSIYEKS